MTSSRWVWVLLGLSVIAQADSLSQLQHQQQQMQQTQILAQHAKPDARCYSQFYHQTEGGPIDVLCSGAIRAYQRAQAESLQAQMVYYRTKGEQQYASRLEMQLDQHRQVFRERQGRLQTLASSNQTHLTRLQQLALKAKQQRVARSTIKPGCYQAFFKQKRLPEQPLDYVCSESIRDYTRAELRYLQAEINYQTALANTQALSGLRAQRKQLEQRFSSRQRMLTSAESAEQPCAAALTPAVHQRCSKLPRDSFYDCLEAACSARVS